MAETLLTPSSIKLFGRVVEGFALTEAPGALLGNNNFLQKQLANQPSFVITGTLTADGSKIVVNQAVNPADLKIGMMISAANAPAIRAGTVLVDVDRIVNEIEIEPPATEGGIEVEITVTAPPTLARIYAFSFEGAFYELPRPPIFLVHGRGAAVGSWAHPSRMNQTGVAARDWDFSGHNTRNDLVFWEYEKGDFSLRLDLDAGPFEQILLQMALRGAAGVSGAGVSGAGVSGAGVSGAGVSGAGVSGAGVSGAGVSGAGVSGAGLRR